MNKAPSASWWFIWLASALLETLIIWTMWNWLCPDLFHLPRIGFLQAGGLGLLGTALFSRTPRPALEDKA